MATFLNQATLQNVFLGEEEKPVLPEQEDSRSASIERRDTAVLGATGKLPEEIEDISFEVSSKVNGALAFSVSNYTESPEDVTQTVEELEDQAKKGADLITVQEYFDNSFHAMDNPKLTSAQNLASMKYQLTVEKLTDAIQNSAAETTAGSVLNWLDRYILRQFPIGAFEDLTLKRQNVSEEFARAIAGNMSMEEYESFLDERLEEYLEQGVLFADNPEAVKDLYATIEKFGNDQTKAANTRLPYNSTLLQTSRSGVDGTDAIGEANELEKFGNDQTTAANTRLPYNSTLAQKKRAVPPKASFVQLANDDTELVKMETNEVPLAFHFVHIAN